jgi:hypothetical protein
VKKPVHKIVLRLSDVQKTDIFHKFFILENDILLKSSSESVFIGTVYSYSGDPREWENVACAYCHIF